MVTFLNAVTFLILFLNLHLGDIPKELNKENWEQANMLGTKEDSEESGTSQEIRQWDLAEDSPGGHSWIEGSMGTPQLPSADQGSWETPYSL